MTSDVFLVILFLLGITDFIGLYFDNYST